MKKILYIIIIVSAFVFASCDKDEEVPVGVVNIENLKITPSPTSAELTWTINSNATVSDVEIEYATDSKFNDYKTADVTLKNNQCSVSLSSLKLKTEYYIRCRAINNISYVTTYLGSFTTLEASTPVLTKVTVSNVTATKATCQFEIISDGGKKMQGCGICYSTERKPTMESNRVSLSASKIGVKKCTIEDLSPETTYYVRAYAINEKGTAYSSEIKFTTIDSDKIIIYTASAKLAETTSTNSDGLHTNAFGGVSIVSHEFANGKGAITFSEKLTIIGDHAFFGCSGLTSVTIPNSVKSIGDDAFSDCTGLTSVPIPNSVISIGNYAFWHCSGLTSVLLPNSVTSIGDRAFEYCSGLTSVTIPNSVTSIGSAAFRECSGLTSVTIGNSVTSIGKAVFFNCSSLTLIEIPNSVTSIGEFAFDGCNGLTSITIPEGIMSIGRRAFSGCSSLTSITCRAVNPPTCGDDVFLGVPKSIPLYVPSSSVSEYKQATGWSEFTNIIPL